MEPMLKKGFISRSLQKNTKNKTGGYFQGYAYCDGLGSVRLALFEHNDNGPSESPPNRYNVTSKEYDCFWQRVRISRGS